MMEIESHQIYISNSVAQKIEWKHNVSEDEVYEVFESDYRVHITRSSRRRNAYLVLGRTFAGRYLAIALKPEADGYTVLTARDMEQHERRRYRR